MPWYNKEQPTPFDSSPIEGLLFLHGDAIARRYGQEHTRGKKYPLIHFPSGLERELKTDSLHLSGQVTLPLHAGLEQMYEHLLSLVELYHYEIGRTKTDELLVLNPYTQCAYALRYDRSGSRLEDIRRLPQAAMELLPGEVRAALPPLYANEVLGLEAVAPLKLFTPDANWTWYASEFNGDDLFFGLVSGFELELGYFSLSELESIRGPLGLPLERDLYYETQPLRVLQEHQRRLRGE